MIIAKGNEEKRSKIWRIGFVTSTIVIIALSIYLIIKLFTGNPLDGNWIDEDGNYELKVVNSGTLIVSIPDLAEDTNVDVKMAYTMDKEAKTISISFDEGEIDSVVEKSEGQYTEEMLKSSLGSIATTFIYSVEQDELTLTETEYGDQMIFIKE